MRSERRRDLLRLLHDGKASSQKAIVRALQEAGHNVTQATVSRDLRELGAMRVRVGADYAYKLPDEVPRSQRGDLLARNLIDTLRDFAIEIKDAASIVVISTAPGHAGAVARALDLAGPPEAIGTIAGDDTIFVATESSATASQLARSWTTSLEGGTWNA